MDSSKGGHEPTLVYPKHRFTPKELLQFIEHPGFTQDWDFLSLDSDDLLLVQAMVMANPRGARLVPGTGGLRELEASRQQQEVEYGLVRFWVYYAYFEEAGAVLLVMVSDEPVELNATLARAVQRELTEQENEFQNGPIKFRNVR